MEEVVLKREADVTSAEALDQISLAYPDAEILSFRRVKQAGESSEFFVARLRIHVAGSEDVVLDSEDIVIEDKKHEDEEEEKMNEIIRLLKTLVDQSEPTPQEDEPAPLPEPQKPAIGTAGPGAGMSPIASVVIERNANIPKALARVELIREFGHGFKIGNIKKSNGKYRAELIRKKSLDIQGEEDGEVPAHAGDAAALDAWIDQQAESQQAEQQRKNEAEQARYEHEKKQREQDPSGAKIDAPRDEYNDPRLSTAATLYLDFLGESGINIQGVKLMRDAFFKMDPQEQNQFVRSMKTPDKEQRFEIPDNLKRFRGKGRTGPLDDFGTSENAASFFEQKSKEIQKIKDPEQRQRAKDNLNKLKGLVRRVPQEDQMTYLQSNELGLAPSVETPSPYVKNWSALVQNGDQLTRGQLFQQYQNLMSLDRVEQLGERAQRADEGQDQLIDASPTVPATNNQEETQNSGVTL